jgi:ABC-type branched-subunit amino acid transport system permease subunit
VILLVAYLAWGSDGTRATLIVFAYYAALAQMWNLLAGYAGLVTFGQQLFIGLGGYTFAVGAERLGLGVWPSSRSPRWSPARSTGAQRRPLDRLLPRGRPGHLIVLGAVSVIVMLVAPRGIAGFVRDRFGWTLFPVARRSPHAAPARSRGA